MKTRFIGGLIVVAGLPFISSCKHSDPKIDPIVGTWVRNQYQFTNVPTGFTKNWENYKTTSFGETGYTVVFNSNKTYSRGFEGYPDPASSSDTATVDVNDAGKWTLNGTSLTLEPDNPDDKSTILEPGYWPIGLEFELEGSIADSKMILSRTVTLTLIQDAILDTLTNKNYLTDNSYTEVDVKILYTFRKL